MRQTKKLEGGPRSGWSDWICPEPEGHPGFTLHSPPSFPSLPPFLPPFPPPPLLLPPPPSPPTSGPPANPISSAFRISPKPIAFEPGLPRVSQRDPSQGGAHHPHALCGCWLDPNANKMLVRQSRIWTLPGSQVTRREDGSFWKCDNNGSGTQLQKRIPVAKAFATWNNGVLSGVGFKTSRRGAWSRGDEQSQLHVDNYCSQVVRTLWFTTPPALFVRDWKFIELYTKNK